MDNESKKRIEDIVDGLRSRLQLDPDYAMFDDQDMPGDPKASELDDTDSLDIATVGGSIFSYDDDPIEAEESDNDEDVTGSGLLFINPDEGVIVDEHDLSADGDNNGYTALETPPEILGVLDEDDCEF